MADEPKPAKTKLVKGMSEYLALLASANADDGTATGYSEVGRGHTPTEAIADAKTRCADGTVYLVTVRDIFRFGTQVTATSVIERTKRTRA